MSVGMKIKSSSKGMTWRLSYASLVTSLSRRSPFMSLRGNFVTVAISCLFLFLVACGDSDSATRASGGSSLSECEDSSCVALSGASAKSNVSSSSVNSSSSSVTLATPCKTETEDNCEYGSLTDDRDGQTYKTVKIGDQWWMAENLNYAYLQSTTTSDSSSFCYKDSLEYCEKYGRLYFWSAAMDSVGLFSSNSLDCGYGEYCSPTYPVRGVCPKGWHLPERNELETLIIAIGGTVKYLGRDSIASVRLKAQGCGGTDEFGFSMLLSGSYYFSWSYEYDFMNEGRYTFIWSATQPVDVSIRTSGAYEISEDGMISYVSKNSGYSVRCIKD